MGRKARQESILGYYHITKRGISKKDIFLSDNDREKFLEILSELTDNELETHCFDLMGNHLHLLVWTGSKEVLSQKMKILFMRYTMYFNRTYDRDGPLCKSRYFSKAINDYDYMRRCIRYILRNPIDIGIKMFYDYKWSSIRCYFSNSQEYKFVSRDAVQECFNNSKTYFTNYLGKVNDPDEELKSYTFPEKRRVRNSAAKDRAKVYTYIKERFNIYDPRKLNYKERVSLAVRLHKAMPYIPQIRICECVDISDKTLRKFLCGDSPPTE